MQPSIVFFGSFQEYSVIVLDQLRLNFQIVAVVTTPPAPKGRHLALTPTEVHTYSNNNNTPVHTLEDLDDIPDIPRPDFIVVAGYGKLIPSLWLEFPKVSSINLHPSLLPFYRGRFPAEWAILRSETETGVTLLKMSPEFDKGPIYAQSKIPILPTDTKQSLYHKLFTTGASLLIDTLPKIKSGELAPTPQPEGKYFYARGLTREDGFVPWEIFQSQVRLPDSPLEPKLRALMPWPGVWTTDPSGKRVKLISLTPPTVQYEGKKPSKL